VRRHGRTIIATTVPDPTAGLVVYDLRTALGRLHDAAPARRAPRKAAARKPTKPTDDA